jgi:phosphonate transport system substrate-binding protein
MTTCFSRNPLVACLLAFGLGLPALAQDCEDPAVLRFASIPKSSTQQQGQTYRPLIRELERVLHKRVELVHSNSYGAVVEGLHAGHIDLGELGPASYAVLLDRRGPSVTAFAALSYASQADSATLGTYRSVLIVREDSGYRSVQDLRGKTLSLTDPLSTSGALLPIQAIRKLTGQPMESYFSRVTYAGSHLRAIEAVHKGLVGAAFVSSKRMEEYQKQQQQQQQQPQQKPRTAGAMAMLWQSPPIPTDPFVYRDRLCKRVTDKIRSVFFDSSTALKPLFDALGARHFVPVSQADYQSLREAISVRQP